jgi:hypothetical protein
MNKNYVNYALDAVIALAFVIASVTGLAFMAMGSGGYQGGRNGDFQTVFLGISRTSWSDLHTLTSIVMIAGVFVHLVLHWRWIVCVTGRILAIRPRRSQEPCELSA